LIFFFSLFISPLGRFNIEVLGFSIGDLLLLILILGDKVLFDDDEDEDEDDDELLEELDDDEEDEEDDDRFLLGDLFSVFMGDNDG
jgi:hypothetical protein